MRNTQAVKRDHGMRLVHSRAAVVKQTSVLFQRYVAAGRWLREELREATGAYAGFLHAEAEGWQHTLAADIREVGLRSPRAVGTSTLQSLTRLLEGVRQLGKRSPQSESTTAEASPEPEPPAEPLDDYQQLTAKAIVAQLKEADSSTLCDAIIAFEENHKQRLTVLRAAKARRARLAA